MKFIELRINSRIIEFIEFIELRIGSIIIEFAELIELMLNSMILEFIEFIELQYIAPSGLPLLLVLPKIPEKTPKTTRQFSSCGKFYANYFWGVVFN